jgi:hypothetical protein
MPIGVRRFPPASALLVTDWLQPGAKVLGISRRIADRLWAVAKAWLHQRMHQG